MENSSGLLHFINVNRDKNAQIPKAVRVVHRTEILKKGQQHSICDYMANKVPLFYRNPAAITSRLKQGFFLTAINETIDKLPSSPKHQVSHFGEIVAAVFAEEVLQLRKLYTKLSMLTAENSNAYKMDLVMYNPNSAPIEFVFGEVKCSPKSSLPSKHDKSCYKDIFDSLNKYKATDQRFDLTAANDNLAELPEEDQAAVRQALMPYSNSVVRYAGFAVIDNSTYCANEAAMLQTRKNKKSFDVDIVCFEDFKSTATQVFDTLKKLRAITA